MKVEPLDVCARGLGLVRLRGLRRGCPVRLTAGSFLFGAHLLDFEEAFLIDELEDLGHGGFGCLGGEVEDEGQVGGLRVEMGQVRQFGCVALDLQFAQMLQLPDEQERLVGMAEQLAMRLENDAEGTRALAASSCAAFAGAVPADASSGSPSSS